MRFPTATPTLLVVMSFIVVADCLEEKITASSLTGSDPISLFDLPVVVPGSSYQVDPFDVEAIRNTFAHYILALDGKNFAALSLSLAPDIVANYSAGALSRLTPLSVLQSTLSKLLEPVTTQHILGTQIIDIISPTTAFSVGYFQANHWGTGAYEGEIYIAYGQWQDVWKKQKDHTWRVARRNVVYMGPFSGNASIFGPQ